MTTAARLLALGVLMTGLVAPSGLLLIYARRSVQVFKSMMRIRGTRKRSTGLWKVCRGVSDERRHLDRYAQKKVLGSPVREIENEQIEPLTDNKTVRLPGAAPGWTSPLQPTSTGRLSSTRIS